MRRSSLSAPGVRRIRRGRGFSYLTPEGAPVTDTEILDRINGLVIPPAWRKVWICPHANGHIQAVGIDDAGRKQYLYHEQWREERDEEKHDRVLALAKILPSCRARLATDVAGRGLTRKRVLAASLLMIDLGIFRTGGEEYAEEHDTHGAATLLRRHVKVQGERVLFSYRAKGGIPRKVEICSRAISAVMKSLLRAKPSTNRMLAYRDKDGWHEIHAADINARFKEVAGDEFSVKDLRTWNATVLAAAAFASHDTPETKRAQSRVEAAVMREVSEALGNTPAVVRNSYVDPRVVRAYAQSDTIRAAAKRAAKAQSEEEAREIAEKATIRLITRMISS